jgi:nicotinamide-nucleotide amidase
MPLLLDDDHLAAKTAEMADLLRRRGWRIVTAESCTGGLIAALCTSLAGSSDWFERGFVTYSNAAKAESLGVDAALIASHGAVSEATALAMARGALARSAADVALAVTGIAGPTGATADKPVGLVWLGWASRDEAGTVQAGAARQVWPGDRTAVRSATVQWGLERLLALARRA